MSVTQSISFRLTMTNQEKLKILKNQVRAFGSWQVRTTISISKKEDPFANIFVMSVLKSYTVVMKQIHF